VSFENLRRDVVRCTAEGLCLSVRRHFLTHAKVADFTVAVRVEQNVVEF
jgi:hypothetical protein